jgi:hypothetical protein
MGMSHVRHRRALLTELGAMLSFGFVVAVVLAVSAAVIVLPRLDPLPTIPPGPLFVAPTTVVAVVLGVVAIASWLGAWVTTRAARKTGLGAVMRVAE